MIKQMVVGFFLLGVDATLSAQFQGNEMSSGLCQDFINRYIKP